MNDRPTPETDAFFFRTDIDWDTEVEFARRLERERDEAREERDQYKSLLIRLHNDLFVHHKGEAVRDFKKLFREENYN